MHKEGSMKLLCPVCEKETQVEPLNTIRKVNVKGEIFEVPIQLYKCLECGYDQIEDHNNPQDEIEIAFREYRKKHNMLQPEEIKSIRKKYGLTQQELSEILGVSQATLSRYENGGLQEVAHDRLLQFIAEPQNMYSLIEKNKNLLPDTKIDELKKKISEIVDNIDKNRYEFFERKHNATSEKYRGNKTFSFDLFEKVVLYIVNKIEALGNVVTKTKLHKLMFYIDFLAYKEIGHSITGTVYVKLPYGPVPNGFQTALELMEGNGLINVIERYPQEGDAVTYIIQSSKPVYGIDLSEEEKKIIDFVISKLATKKASELSEMSHEEIAYQETEEKRKIDYGLAEFLKITTPTKN